jgi:hypothetical protein
MWHFSRPLVFGIPSSEGLVLRVSGPARLLHLGVRLLRSLYSDVVADCVFSATCVGSGDAPALVEGLELGKCGCFSAPDGIRCQQLRDTLCVDLMPTLLADCCNIPVTRIVRWAGILPFGNSSDNISVLSEKEETCR